VYVGKLGKEENFEKKGEKTIQEKKKGGKGGEIGLFRTPTIRTWCREVPGDWQRSSSDSQN